MEALRTLSINGTDCCQQQFNYQMEHINRLSEEFYRLQISFFQNLPMHAAIPAWYGYWETIKQIAEQILEYDETIKKTPAIQELIEILGKQRQGRNALNDCRHSQRRNRNTFYPKWYHRHLRKAMISQPACFPSNIVIWQRNPCNRYSSRTVCRKTPDDRLCITRTTTHEW